MTAAPAWSRVRLKNVARVVMGQSPPSEACNSNGTGLPFLQGNAEFGKEHPRARQFCPDAPKAVPAGALLLSVRAPVGAINTADRAYAIGRGLCAVLPDARLLKVRWVYYALLDAMWQLHSVARGSTYDGVSAAEVGCLRLLLPPLPTQHAIAAYLDRETARLDALIAKKERLIALLEEKRTALISAAVTKGLDPSVPMKDSGVPWLGEVPGHWGVVQLRRIARMESGHTPSRSEPAHWIDCDIPWVSLNDVGYLATHDYIDHTANLISALGMANSSARLLPTGTVVLSRDATVGRCAILARSMATSQHFVDWVCGAQLLPEYLLQVFRGPMQYEFFRLTNGATLRTIGMDDAKRLVVPLPPVAEQQEIVAYVGKRLAALVRLVEAVQAAIARLREYRTALITAAVTGQIDVRQGDQP